jgi:hypothetical protein
MAYEKTNTYQSTPKNEIDITSKNYIEKLRKHAENTDLAFGEYERLCVVNAIRTLDPMIKTSNYVWQNFDKDNVFSVLQQVAFLQLNPSATPRECYFIIRKNYDNKAKKWLSPTVEFGVEGAGNDVILREYGVNVKEVKSYIIYEGDEFDLGGIDGWEYKLPRHTRTYKTNKPLYAVYLIKKTTGEIDVSISHREDVKKSLLANAKQNGASDTLLFEMNKLSLDEILETPKYRDYKIKKTYSGNTYETPLFNPSYTSPISMESMIERKLRNHATRRYPKNFNPEVQKLYEDTFEDEKYERKNVIEAEGAEEIIENSKQEFVENANKEELETETTEREDYEVKEDELEKDDLEDLEEENLDEQDKIIPDDNSEFYETNKDETTQKDDDDTVEEEVIEEPKNNMPDWM